MIQSLIIGLGLIITIVLLWTFIQTQWRDTFQEEYFEDDVLAGRRSCSNCGCTTVCANKEKNK